jgi:reactive intermediate/imine deaminase
MSKSSIESDQVVKNMGPFSQCVQTGDLLFLSGQVAWDATGTVTPLNDVAGQARQALDNMRHLVEAAGGKLDDVVQITFYTTDISQWEAVRRVREEYFTAPYPAATTVEVSALRTAELLIEIDAVAALN